MASLTRLVSISLACCSVFCLAARFPARAQQDKKSAGYHVVRGWPALPEGYVLGEVPGVAVDSHNHVFVFHRTARSTRPVHVVKEEGPIPGATILCFDGDSGALVALWGGHMFLEPHGLSVDKDDNIWLTDRTLNQVYKFSHDGKLLLTVGEKGVAGLDGGHFFGPSAVAVAADGSFYVSDGYGNSRVAKFSPTGEFLFDWGKKGIGPSEFDTVHNVALDAQGRVYIADRGNARVQIFTADGKFITQWKSDALGRPWALAFGADGYAYVLDGGDLKLIPPDRSHILKLDLTGKILDQWSAYGNYDGQIYWGHDIAVGRDGAVYVGDILGHRIQKFVPDR
jgi:DNA-binding beta-propeller fold protein YncE